MSDNIKGNPISISWDKEDGEDYIIIRDLTGKIILKCLKFLWNGNENSGFSAITRGAIINNAMGCYG